MAEMSALDRALQDNALVVASQESLREEDFHRENGRADTMFVVVKAHPFKVTFAVAEHQKGLSLSDYSQWEASLYYDKPALPQVLLVEKDRLVPKFRVSSGTEVELSNCRLAALSSKHDKSLFRVRLLGKRKSSAPASSPDVVEGLSHPIMCISKPTVNNGAAAGASARVKREPNISDDDDGGDADDGDDRSARKRRATAPAAKLTEAEVLLEEVSALQVQSQKLLRRLHEYNNHDGAGAHEHVGGMPPPLNAAARGKLANFMTLMRNLVESYARIVGPDRRTARVRRVASMLPSSLGVLELQQLLRESTTGAGSFADAQPIFNLEDLVFMNDQLVPIDSTLYSSTFVSIPGLDEDDGGFVLPMSNSNASDLAEPTECACGVHCHFKHEAERNRAFFNEANRPH